MSQAGSALPSRTRLTPDEVPTQIRPCPSAQTDVTASSVREPSPWYQTRYVLPLYRFSPRAVPIQIYPSASSVMQVTFGVEIWSRPAFAGLAVAMPAIQRKDRENAVKRFFMVV